MISNIIFIFVCHYTVKPCLFLRCLTFQTPSPFLHNILCEQFLKIGQGHRPFPIYLSILFLSHNSYALVIPPPPSHTHTHTHIQTYMQVDPRDYDSSFFCFKVPNQTCNFFHSLQSSINDYQSTCFCIPSSIPCLACLYDTLHPSTPPPLPNTTRVI